MATAVILPKQGNSVETCMIVEWRKNAGDRIQLGEVLCVVETDKAVFEIEASADGVLLERFFEVGDDVPVLTTIAVVGESGERTTALKSQPSTIIIPENQSAFPKESTVPALTSSVDAPRLFISPRAKGAAQQLGVAPQLVSGSGPGGRIIERDVLATDQARLEIFKVPKTAIETTVPANAKELPMTGIRRLIAERMMRSLHSSAQLTLNASADATALLECRRKLKESPQKYGLTDVTINDLLLYVVSRVLSMHPLLNSTLQNGSIWLFDDVHLAFAVDSPRGLLVPVITQAQRLNLKNLSLEAKRLIAACLEGRVTSEELNGGTFTVTNLGSLGIESLTPVLNPPQSATLGIGSIKLAPVEVNGQIQFQKQIGLSLTIDHQVIDGAVGARFLQDLLKAIAAVELYLAF